MPPSPDSDPPTGNPRRAPLTALIEHRHKLTRARWNVVPSLFKILIFLLWFFAATLAPLIHLTGPLCSALGIAPAITWPVLTGPHREDHPQ
jgi:hypothetical protein